MDYMGKLEEQCIVSISIGELLNDLINYLVRYNIFLFGKLESMTETRPHPLSKPKPTNSSPIYH
jgi:hypothetical protein